jgi:hypothetical protein
MYIGISPAWLPDGKEAQAWMANLNTKKKRAAVNASKKTPTLKDPPMKEIEDTVAVVDKLMQNVAKMTPTQRTRVSVMVAHAMLGLGINSWRDLKNRRS